MQPAVNQPVVLRLDCPKLQAAMADISLTQRWEVLRRSANPLTNHELADACGVSDGVAVNMINSATKRIHTKLGVRNRAEFAARMKSGWVEAPHRPR